MSYESKAIANYFIDLATREKKSLTPMKLQKLIYFAHGWNLAIHDEPLIDEQIEAWKFGPVINTIYHEFKHFGNQPITDHATDIELDEENTLNFRIITPKINSDDIDTKALLDKVWEIYGKYSAVQLSNATHQPGTPWEQTWGSDGVPTGTDINQNIIKQFFVDLANTFRPTQQATN